jgi:hypothetical protein
MAQTDFNKSQVFTWVIIIVFGAIAVAVVQQLIPKLPIGSGATAAGAVT